MRHRLLEALADGRWVTAGRIIAYCRILLLLEAAGLILLLALSRGRIDSFGRPIGTDFISFYAAGDLAHGTAAATVYRASVHFAAEQRIAGSAAIPYYAFYYPPVFLLLCWPLARLPYLAALGAWLAATGAGYVAALRAILRRSGVLLPSLAFPACFVTVGHGQNGFLTAALYGAALRLIDRRPMAAGALLGALCYKPQLGLLVPVALICGRRWRALSAAAAAALLLCGASVALFGRAAWSDYVALLPQVGRVFETGAVDFDKMVSVFGAVRLLGGGIAPARAAQTLAALAAALATAAVWGRPAGPAARAIVLSAGTLLAAPVLLDYDLVLAAVPIAWLIAEAGATGFRRWEKTLLAVLFLLPLVVRPIAAASHLPLGPAMGLTLLLLGLARARDTRSGGEPTIGLQP